MKAAKATFKVATASAAGALASVECWQSRSQMHAAQKMVSVTKAKAKHVLELVKLLKR